MAVNQYRTGTLVAGGVGTPSLSSIKRWGAKALNPLNGSTILPFRSTGNKRVEVLRGRDILISSLHHRSWPISTAAEVAATVARFSHNPRIYSNSQITEAEDRLGLTRKIASTEAEQAYTPANILRADLFFYNFIPNWSVRTSKE